MTNEPSIRQFAASLIGPYALYAVLAIVVLFPLSWAFLGAFKGENELFIYPPTLWPRNFSFAAVSEVLNRGEFPRFVINTFFVSAASVVLTLLFSSLAAFAFSRWTFPLKEPILVVLLALQLIPSTVNVVPYYLIMNELGLLNTLTGLIIIYTATHIPFTIWLLKGFFDKIPTSLDEAASIDGCGKFRIFARIIIPLSLPGLSVAGYLIFISCWAEFLIPFVIARSRDVLVVSVGLYGYFQADGAAINSQLAATMISIVPVIVVYFLAQRFLISDLTAHAEK